MFPQSSALSLDTIGKLLVTIPGKERELWKTGGNMTGKPEKLRIIPVSAGKEEFGDEMIPGIWSRGRSKAYPKCNGQVLNQTK